jgi:hypothetical protein
MSKAAGTVCLVCGAAELRGRVTLVYEAPLAARGGGIKVAGLKVHQLDVRDRWKAMSRRPVFCGKCGTKYVYDAATDGLEAVDAWEEEGRDDHAAE